MKGFEILSNWNNVSEIIKRVNMVENVKGEELGNFLRINGYKVEYEGFSVCHFKDMKHGIRYSVVCYNMSRNFLGKWKLSNEIHFDSDSKLIPRTIESIEIQKEYATMK